MNWYESIFLGQLKTAAKPPSYLMERISDLQHASELSKTSPLEANVVISSVVSQLSAHHDIDFIEPLKEAHSIMRDNPARARSAIEKIIQAMINEKNILKRKRDELEWGKKNTI